MRRLVRGLVFVLCAVSALSCKQSHRSASIPKASEHLLSTLRVADDGAAVQLVHGFYGPEGNAWRWTGPRFAVVLAPPAGSATRGALLVLKVTVPQNSLTSLGPITLHASLPGLELAPETFTRAGDASFSREIPGSLLASDAVEFDFLVDKTLPPSGADSRRLGLVVTSIALQPR